MSSSSSLGIFLVPRSASMLIPPPHCLSVNLCLWAYIFPSLCFKSVALYLKLASYRPHVLRPVFFIQYGNLCISVPLFRPFTFNRNLSIVEVKPAVLLLVFSLSHLSFATLVSFFLSSFRLIAWLLWFQFISIICLQIFKKLQVHQGCIESRGFPQNNETNYKTIG